MITFDFVAEDEGVTIENVLFEPTVSHYTAKREDIENTRRDFKIYMLEDYTNDIAALHGLNGYNGIEITKENYQDIVTETIPAEFLNQP